MPSWAFNTDVDQPTYYLDARRISAWWGIPDGKHPLITGIHFASTTADADKSVTMAFDKNFRLRPTDKWADPDVHELERLTIATFDETGSAPNRDVIFHFLSLGGDSVFPMFSPQDITKSIVINTAGIPALPNPLITFFYEVVNGGMIFDKFNMLQDIKVIKRQISAGQPFHWVGNKPGDRYFTVGVEGNP